MKVPALLYGRAAQVKPRARKIARELLRLDTFDVFETGEMLDTADKAGLLLVAQDSMPLVGDHYRLYAITVELLHAANPPGVSHIMERWMTSSWSEPWRFLGVVDQLTTNQLYRNRDLLEPYVEAAAKFWPIYQAEGLRFAPFVNGPLGPWEVMRNLGFALAHLGVPSDQLANPPADGLAAFLDRIRAAR